MEDEYVRSVVGGTGSEDGRQLRCQPGSRWSRTRWAIRRCCGWTAKSANTWKKWANEHLFKIRGELYTAPLEGTIMPGITRDQDPPAKEVFGVNVREEHLAIADIFEEHEKGAAWRKCSAPALPVISPVGGMKWEDMTIRINGGKMASHQPCTTS